MWGHWNVLDLIMAGSVFVLVFGVWLGGILVWHLRRSRQTQQLSERLGLIDQSGPRRELRLWHEGKEVTTVVPGLPQKLDLTQRMGRLCKEAGWNISAQGVVLGLVCVCLLFFVATTFLSHSILMGAVAATTVVVVFWIVLQKRIDNRMSRFERQLVDGLDLAARSLRAGHPLIASFQAIAEEVEPPVGQLFGEICQQQALGVSLEQALQQVSMTSSSPDLKFFATAVSIQLRSGGNLADMMVRLAEVIRDRIRLGRRVHVLTAQTHFSKNILLAIPLVMLLVISVLNRPYLEPLFSTRQGKAMLIAAGVGMILGAWSMNRLAKLKY